MSKKPTVTRVPDRADKRFIWVITRYSNGTYYINVESDGIKQWSKNKQVTLRQIQHAFKDYGRLHLTSNKEICFESEW